MLNNATNKTLITVVGPTAIGKTACAVQIAKHFKSEVISADSRQFYKEMQIGTARPQIEELEGVPHHFLGSHSIEEEISAGKFETLALDKIDQLFQKHDVVILTGGSGLYIQAVLDGMDDFPSIPKEIRQELNHRLTEQGLAHLQDELKQRDPVYFDIVDINNPQRVIRALEVCIGVGLPYSQFRKKTKKERNFNTIKIGLTTNRENLYKRINLRVDQMIEHGLVEEVKSLLHVKHYNALNTVGYKEFFDYFDGNTPLEVAIEQVKQNTRRFAKRQITWFKKDEETIWFEPSDYDMILGHIKKGL